MDIEFDNDEAGFWEARLVLAMATQFSGGTLREGDAALLSFLKDASLAQMNRTEYASVLKEAGIRDGVWPSWSLVNQLWRRTLGPSQLEEDLSAQRSEALERADRAESSAFDAMAEAAQTARERDHLQEEVDRLKAALKALETQLARATPGEARED